MSELVNFIKKNPLPIIIGIIGIMLAKCSIITLKQYGFFYTCLGVAIGVAFFIWCMNKIKGNK